MIYTVTFNPSLDYVVSVPNLQLGKTNRTSAEHLYPGGKGINVSIVLSHLAMENTALGFVAGFTGEEIEKRLKELGIRTDFIRIEDGLSRINVKVQNMEGTEINGMGPQISGEKTEELLRRLDRLTAGDAVVLAGSVPASMPKEIYRDILRRLQDKQILTVVDASGDLLLNVLEYRPFLVKPNQHELGELFDVELKTREDVIPWALKLRELGAANVLVSMAGEGAVLAAEDGSVWLAKAPEGELVNGVGAGDSMVAGFMAGWLAQSDYRHAFRMAVAAGSASAYSEHLAGRGKIDDLYCQAVLERWFA